MQKRPLHRGVAVPERYVTKVSDGKSFVVCVLQRRIFVLGNAISYEIIIFIDSGNTDSTSDPKQRKVESFDGFEK